MKQSLSKQLAISLETLLLAGAVYFLAMYFYVSISRMSYPFELEWMEGGSVDHVRRVLEGLPLYIKPSIEFTPFIYNPLFFYLSALVSQVTGLGFLPLRLVSALATAGSLGLIYLFLWKETGRYSAGIIGAGMFAASYIICGAWFDLARPDMLFLFFLLASVYFLHYFDRSATAAAAAVLAALSFFAKQNALPVGIILAIYAVLKFKGRKRLIYPIVFSSMVIIWLIFFHFGSDGWYEYYIFTLPGQHVIHYDMLLSVLTDDMISHVPVLLFLSAFCFLYWLWKERNLDRVFHLCFFGTLFAMSVAARMHSGGYANALIPAYAVMAIYASLGFDSLIWNYLLLDDEHSSGDLEKKNSVFLVLLSTAAYILLALAFIWQFRSLRYDAQVQIPEAEDVNAGNELVNLMKNIEGDIYVPYHGYLPSLAGKAMYAQGMALEDVFRSTDEAIRDDLKKEIRQSIESGRFSAIILDGEWRFMDEINRYYEAVPIEYQGDAYVPVTGMPTRPSLIYLPRQ